MDTMLTLFRASIFIAPSFIAASILATPLCHAETVAWRTPTGGVSTIEVYPEDSFLEVIDTLRQQLYGELCFSSSGALQPEFLIDFSLSPSFTPAVATKGPTRSYLPLSSSQQKDITFIITTLGNASLTAIASSKSSLKKAGERIANVHPFIFIQYIFSDEKLKSAMHNLKGRAFWIWSEFFNGIKESLDEEADRDNLNAYIEDFASNLNLEHSLIHPLVTQKNWKDLINTLLTQIPRGGNTDRYNM